MEQSKEYTVNIKDCVKYIVSKWKVLLLVTSIFALLAAGVAALYSPDRECGCIAKGVGRGLCD